MDWQNNFVETKVHIKHLVELFREQADQGRLFLHESPGGATDWDAMELNELERSPGIGMLQTGNCVYPFDKWKTGK